MIQHTKIPDKSAQKIETNLSQHTKFTSDDPKWLNHEWKETFDLDVDPFDETTFLFKVPLGKFILKSNDALISINW